MDYKKAAFGLGLFSLALGAFELVASKKIAQTLDVEGHEGVIKAFGAREVFAGLTLVQGPGVALRVWNRVLGDAMDLTALALAARQSPRNGAVWGSMALVAGVTALDVVVALGLERTSARTLPKYMSPV